jgi:hypothetical protein
MNRWSIKNLQAVDIGPSVPHGDFLVRVHSIFKKAINLQVTSCQEARVKVVCKERDKACDLAEKSYEEPNRNLITIVSFESFNYPQSIRIASTEDFTKYGLVSNDIGRLDRYGIELKQPNLTASICIPFAGATRLVHKPLPAIPHLNAFWQIAANLLTAMQKKAMVELCIEKLAIGSTTYDTMSVLITKAVVNFGEAIQSGDIDVLHNATIRLIGLGSGLTPSGDDFLCGFIAAVHCRPNMRIDHWLKLSKIILANLTKTNEISATFLYCAIKGEVCDTLWNFAKAIHNGISLEARLEQLCKMGHSSGMDTATGFLYGLKIWNRQPQYAK